MAIPVDLQHPGTFRSNQAPVDRDQLRRQLDWQLARLIGEPFRFLRISYGNELTLHFGNLRPSRSPRMTGVFSGLYILGTRGSSWVLKSGDKDGGVECLQAAAFKDFHGVEISKENLESSPPIRSGSRVESACCIPDQSRNVVGVFFEFSDNSKLTILPDRAEVTERPNEQPHDPDLPEGEGLPAVADWEIITPQGLLSAGPGVEWRFVPKPEK